MDARSAELSKRHGGQDVRDRRMGFESILYVSEGADAAPPADTTQPDIFVDLNLDQVVAAVIEKCEFDLKPFFHSPLTDVRTVQYRHEVMQDLEDQSTIRVFEGFAAEMRAMRVRQDQSIKANGSRYKIAAQRLFLGAVQTYCNSVERLSRDLEGIKLRSTGLNELRRYLGAYTGSDNFRVLSGDARALLADLDRITYCLLLHDGSVTVQHYAGEQEYTVVVEDIFRKFRGNPAKRLDSGAYRHDPVNHIEAQVQERVALLFPDTFNALERFCESHRDYVDNILSQFDREIHFYLTYLAFVERLRNAGLRFCLPRVSRTSKAIYGRDAFDVALANKLTAEKAGVIRNDFALSGPERIFVVTGPNQGGKTTFARMIGQMHYLASLGCPVPGADARLYLCDRIFTHFERPEDPANLRGKLQDDLIRIRQVVDEATPNSLILLNELFSSTTFRDAIFLSTEVMARISALDALGVWVTFLDELASASEKTVSIVSAVDPRNPAVRTYKLERRPADGLAYALAIAQKYRVTYESLKERITV
jgi:hypothetical protein